MKYLYILFFATLFWGCNNPPEVDPDPVITLVPYPNPAGKRIYIHVENDELSPFTLQIFDPEGKKSFSSGMYQKEILRIVFTWNLPNSERAHFMQSFAKTVRFTLKNSWYYDDAGYPLGGCIVLRARRKCAAS